MFCSCGKHKGKLIAIDHQVLTKELRSFHVRMREGSSVNEDDVEVTQK
jgi:hypothetical protein